MKKLKDILFVIFIQLTFILFLLIFITINSKSQTITNGTFDMVPVGFGWNTSCVSLPYEMFPERVYRGPSWSNRVAEIDLGAGAYATNSNTSWLPNLYLFTFIDNIQIVLTPLNLNFNNFNNNLLINKRTIFYFTYCKKMWTRNNFNK